MTVEALPPPDAVVLDEAFFADPDAFYRQWRPHHPVVRAVAPGGLTVWVVTRYDDARAALADPRLAKDAVRVSEVLTRRAGPASIPAAFAGHMLNSDPPDHTRLRKLVGKAFTARAIARLRPRIEALAAELADAMVAEGPVVDLLDSFAFPLAMTVICELLGVPVDRRDEFRRWSDTILSGAEGEPLGDAIAAMTGFLAELVAAKAARPADDMLSEIVRVSTSDGDALSARETTAMAFLLLVAGHETTVNLIGNGMLALLRHPDQLARLRGDPDRIPAAVEEFLRFDGPLNLATARFTTEPVTISGVTVPADELVLVALMGANRDPDRFDDPGRFDVDRRAAGHVAFGYGIHHCLGAPLARLESEVAFRTLLNRFPGITLAAEPVHYRRSLLIHGLTRLGVRLSD